MTAYPEINEGYNNKMKNKLFGLLCEFEKVKSKFIARYVTSPKT